MKKKVPFSGIIVPTVLEPNGKMKRFLEIVKKPKIQEGYQKLLSQLKTDPENFSRKLREISWKGKNVDKIYEELVREKSR